MAWGGATDGTFADDRLFVVSAGRLWVVDLTTGELTYQIRLGDALGVTEPRPVKWVENVKGAVLVFCVDPAHNPATRVYSITGADVKAAFDVPTPVVHLDTAPNGAFAFIAGATSRELWRAAPGAAPALTYTFPQPVACFDVNRVCLTNGEVWDSDGSNWFSEATFTQANIPTPATAIGAWKGGYDFLRGMGAVGLQMWETGAEGDWAPSRLLFNPTNTPDVITRINVLRRLVKVEDIPKDEQTGGPGEATTKETETLLILTEPNGLLISLNLSPYDETSGAVALTTLSTVDLTPGGAKELKSAT